MEEEFREIEVEDPCLCGNDEIDLDYEFDAPRFWDFTRPDTFWDAAEAEEWFEFAASYPPSPFLMKLRRGNAAAMESVNNVDVAENSDPNMEPEAIDDSNSRGLEYCNQTTREDLSGKTKPLSKSSPSKFKLFSFMKPTASHLAKQKNLQEVQTPTYFRRFQKQNSSSSIDGQLTKRQKLEAGYLRTVARLKHHTLFTHKKTKKVDTDVNVSSKSNVTIPRAPNLETAVRAQRHKSRSNAESDEHTKSSPQMLKARSLNKKAGGTLNCNSISNSETRDLKRTNSGVGSGQVKCRMISKLRGSPDDKKLSSKGERGVFRNIKVFPLDSNDKRLQNEPPTELFSKLSLASEAKQTIKSPSKEQPNSKGLKENRPGSLLEEHEEMNLVKREIQRLCGKQYQCGNQMGSLVLKQACMLARTKS
ncbi:TPX2 central domain [Sesbania bispinosa]|nr:TPX2 central domain [Sesbania bispinosa]